MNSILENQKDFLTYKKKIIFNAGVESVIEYADNKRNFVPQIQLLFSPFGLPFVPIEIVGTNANKIIKSLAWTKDRDNPGGILAVEFVPDAAMIKQMIDIINKYTGNLYSRIWGSLGVELEDLFKPMTLCQLWINGYHVMTGTVRSCARSSQVTNKDKNVSYSLIIEELGNLYNLATLSMDLITQDGLQSQIIDSLQSALVAVSTIKGMDVATGIHAILAAFITTTLRAGGKLSDGFPLALRLLSAPNPAGAISNVSIANFMNVDGNLFQTNSKGGGQQSVWGFIKNFIPNPWMEFFTESGGRTIVTGNFEPPAVMFPGLNYIVARTAPYSNPLLGIVHPSLIAQTTPFELNALSMLIGGDFVIITDDMIQNKNLGVDCANQKTVFHTNYTSGSATQAADLSSKGIKCQGPLNPFASGGIGTFGIREMFQNIDTTCLQGLGLSSACSERIGKNLFGIPLQLLSKNALSNLLAVWFRNQSRFREGSVTVRGLPYARPGMYCLYLPSLSNQKVENIRDIGIYYIDSLTHNYKLNNTDLSFDTTLNLIRGVPLPLTGSLTALLLFDFEVLPPMSGIADGEYTALQAARDIISAI